MTWDYDTITSATPADSLADKIEAAMTDNGSYSHVETVTISTTDYRVWENSSAGFHIILQHATAGTGNLTIMLCETYNSSANTMGYVAAPSNTSYGYITSAYGFTTTNGGSASGFALDTSANIFRPTLTTNTTGFTYAVSASAHRVVAATLVGASYYGPIYAGEFDSFIDGSGGVDAETEPGAFALVNLSSGSGTSGAVTRFVDQVNAGANASGAFRFHSADSHTGTWGVPGALANPFDGLVISRVRYTASPSSGTTLGPRGLLKNIVFMSTSGSYAFGDELNVDGSPKYKVINGSTAVEMI